jgi:tetratricopeptide (TPR) repeat protein
MKAPIKSLRANLVVATSLTLSALPAPAADPADVQGRTVLGTNPLLSDGAAALLSGQWARGIELTQMGLTGAVSQEEKAAALSNLCAGFTALKKYERALEHCDQSLALDDAQWRAWQNRAAALLGLGRIEECLQDIQRGLQLNPDSEALQKTLAIARDQEKLQQERMRHLLES